MNKNAKFKHNFCCSFSRVSRYSLIGLLSVVLLSDAVGAKVGSLQNYSPKRSPEILLDKYRDNFPDLEAGDKQVLLRSYQNQQEIYLAQQPAPTPSIPLNAEKQKLYEQGVKLFQEAEELKKKGNREGYVQAINKYQQALKIVQDIGLGTEEAEINLAIGVIYSISSENLEALKYFNQLLNISREFKLPVLEGSALTLIAQAYTRTGKAREALTLLNQAESIFRAEKKFDTVALVLISIASTHTGLGEIPQTLEPLNQALQIYRDTLKDLPQQATVLNQIGFSYSQMGDPKTALKYYEQALEIQQKRQDLLPAQAETLRNIGSLYNQLGKHEEALNYLNKARKIQHTEDLLIAEGLTIQEVAGIYRSQGDYQGAIEHHKQAKILFHKGGNTALESLSLQYIISIYKNYIGDNTKALEFVDEALKLDKNVTGDIERYAATLNQKGDIHTSQGDYQQALEIYNEALDIARSTNNKNLEARTFSKMASLYELLGDYDLSIKNYKQALQIYKQIPDKPSELMLLPLISNLYMTKEDYPEALKYHNQVLSLSREQNNYRFEIIGLMGLARIYELQKDFPNALKNAETLLSLSRKFEDKYSEAGALSLIGIINRTKGDYKQALTNHQKTLSQYRQLGVRRLEAQTLNNISLTYGLSKQYQQAIDTLNEELELRQELKDSTGEADALYQIAINQRNLGKLEAALSNIQTTINIVENIRGNVQSDELRTSYFATVQNYYKFYIDLLMQLHKKDPTQVCEFNIQDLKIKDRCDAVALHISDRARARSLVELLKAGNVNLRKDVDPQLLAEERRLQNKLKLQETRLSDLLSQKGSSTELINKTNQEITNIIQESQKLTAKIRATKPERAELTDPEDILQLPGIQQQLDKDTILLQYSLGKERSYLWVVTPNSLQSYELPGQEEIAKAANNFNIFVKQPLIENPTPVDIADAITNTEKTANALSQLILNDVAGKLGNKRLVIVADGILHQVSFAALNEPRKSPTSNKYQPLVVNHEIVNLPSISSLATHRKKLKIRDIAPKTLAVLANPVFSADDTRLKNDKPSSVENNLDRSAVETLRNTNQVLEPLPNTQAEGEAILNLVNSPNNKLSAFGLDANYNFATSKELRQYRYLLFATHGIFNTVNPALSGIVLSLVDKQGKPQTRSFLRLNDIFNLDLPAELIVLSACESGLGDDVQGEGLVGLTRGFMYAGAARVTVSLWKVNDKSTKELMIALYKQILEQKKSPAAALNFAQRQMWQGKDFQNPAWKHPRYWAAFTLQGEWR
ncbi:tetratricopeptide repeat protein [Nostoc sp. CHAB 5836]|uniref:CHAT domain-containing tetratricopeptide repeat protein n=1 Tax=Nostoc sp. CHAB 5836 TaxID=2780404 RepID=UPI001E5A7182|nr:CHAT domain-containing protein [Nostoc sp. CHAB 5836]MCC5617034.1 tetratricopeptide repeat protein [Nostoc sp. CHAB 5836]